MSDMPIGMDIVKSTFVPYTVDNQGKAVFDKVHAVHTRWINLRGLCAERQ